MGLYPERYGSGVMKDKSLNSQVLHLSVEPQSSVVGRIWVILLTLLAFSSTPEIDLPVSAVCAAFLGSFVFPLKIISFTCLDSELEVRSHGVSAVALFGGSGLDEASGTEVKTGVRVLSEEVAKLASATMVGYRCSAMSTVVATVTTAACAVPVLASFAGAGFGLGFEELVAFFAKASMTVAILTEVVSFFALNAHEGVVDSAAVLTVDVWADTIARVSFSLILRVTLTWA